MLVQEKMNLGSHLKHMFTANLDRHNIIHVTFIYFCYVKFALENISTNVTVPKKSLQLSMWFSNVKNIHTVHSTHITVQF